MTKRKRKKKKQIKTNVKFELIGLLLIFIAILGSGVAPLNEGFIPSGLVLLFRLFFGMWYFIVSLSFLAIGLFMLIKRRLPNFYDKKMIGLLIFTLGLLLLTHIQLFERVAITDISILKFTWHQLTNAETISQYGGGIIGGILLACCYYLFSLVGTKIIAIFSMMIGIAFIVNVSLGDMFIKTVSTTKSLIQKSRILLMNNKQAQEGNIKNNTTFTEVEPTQTTDPEELVIHEFSHKTSVSEENNDNHKN